jgi:deoxycytidylate deaminase
MAEQTGVAPAVVEVASSRRVLNYLDNPVRPELVLGLVAPIGTPLEGFVRLLQEALKEYGYEPRVHRLSDFLTPVSVEDVELTGTDPYLRYSRLMTQGDRLREVTGLPDVLALLAATKINTERPVTSTVAEPDRKPQTRHLPGVAHILRQLKHPEEVYRLRSIYGEMFILLGLNCPRQVRMAHLVDRGMSEPEIDELMRRDEEEADEFGQKLTDTFHHSDVFLEVFGAAAEPPSRPSLQTELKRFLDLLFGRGMVTPTRREYGMFVAHAAALRSAQLGRQVGAAIMSRKGEILATGTNEVPAFGGGQYWGEPGEYDARDHAEGADLSDLKKLELVGEILSRLDEGWSQLDPDGQRARIDQGIRDLRGTQVLGLTEFMRAVHAEMEALTSAARVGVSVRDTILFSTTFPCHGCAKHIVDAGIEEVIYIEPYTKSRALEMHGDAISVDELVHTANKVRFLPFVGVAPRKYLDLFARSTQEGRKLKLKSPEGKPLNDIGFRLSVSPLSYVEKESLAAESIKHVKEEHGDVFSPRPAGSAQSRVDLEDGRSGGSEATTMGAG